MKNLTHTKIINEIIENVRDDMQDEEIIHLVLEKTVALRILKKVSYNDN